MAEHLGPHREPTPSAQERVAPDRAGYLSDRDTSRQPSVRTALERMDRIHREFEDAGD